MIGVDKRPFCRVYLDYRGPSEEIERLVASLIGGRVTAQGIEHDQLDLLVDHGDSYPPIEERNYADWVNWKYSLEVLPVRQGTSEAEVALPLKVLLEKLNDAGVKAVPSCDYEDLLAPWNRTDA